MPDYQPLRHYDRFRVRTRQQPVMLKQCTHVVPHCTPKSVVMSQTAQRTEVTLQLK